VALQEGGDRVVYFAWVELVAPYPMIAPNLQRSRTDGERCGVAAILQGRLM